MVKQFLLLNKQKKKIWVEKVTFFLVNEKCKGNTRNKHTFPVNLGRRLKWVNPRGGHRND